MLRLRAKLGALAVAGGSAALVLTGGPALASAHAASAKNTTGPEIGAGTVHCKAANANSPHIPLTFRGVVNTRDVGFVLGNGKGKRHTLSTPAGSGPVGAQE